VFGINQPGLGSNIVMVTGVMDRREVHTEIAKRTSKAGHR
jgi:hypothetical protein